MKTAVASPEQLLFPLGSQCTSALSLPRAALHVHGTLSLTIKAAGKQPGCQMASTHRRENNRVLQHHWQQPLTSSCKQRISRVVAFSAPAVADNVNTQSSTEIIPMQFQQLQDVVIVGGGIAGLATALALHRLGIKPLLLEQAEQLRTAGSSIGLWTNAWHALEALGVADSLRENFAKLSGVELIEENGKLLVSLSFDEGSRYIELRAVERKALLEALKEPLPDGTVLYDSQVIAIRKLKGGYTEVHCEDGKRIETKVLIGCDGIGSVVAKWMNMGEPRYAGYTATRGLAVYPDGHNLGYTSKQVLGRGVRAGVVPLDANRIYWFVVFNSSGERITDVELVRKEALGYVKGWPSMITEAINRSSLDTISRRAISDRWMWPVIRPSLYKGGVTLAGDAMHPMTPNLGQGGCCALEDAIILSRALAKALSSSESQTLNGSPESQSTEMERIEFALKSYTDERWPRLLPMTIRSYLTGALMQLDSELMCSVRSKVLPKLLKVDRFVDHTFYDCGTLQ